MCIRDRKLAGRRAAKFNLALSLLPHKSIASLLQNTTPERAARSATALLLARPAGGPNLLQRLLAIALDIDKREAAYRAAARALPPAAQRAVAWLHDRRADHGLLPTAAAIDSAAKVSALLIGAATAAGVDAADLAAELRRQPTALAQASTALAHGQQLAGSRAVVALLGEPQMDDLVSGLSPVLHEPLMRVVLRGDVKRLLGGAVLSAQAMLRAAANERLPRQQRHAPWSVRMDEGGRGAKIAKLEEEVSSKMDAQLIKERLAQQKSQLSELLEEESKQSHRRILQNEERMEQELVRFKELIQETEKKTFWRMQDQQMLIEKRASRDYVQQVVGQLEQRVLEKVEGRSSLA